MNGTFILVFCAMASVLNLGVVVLDYLHGTVTGSTLFSAVIGGILLAQVYYHILFDIGR